MPGFPVSKTRALVVALAAVLALGAMAPIPPSTIAQAATCDVPSEPPPAPTPTPAPPTPTPIAYSDATPVAAISTTPPPIATLDPAAALASELDAVSAALAACLSVGNADTVVALTTDRYLGQLFGGGEPLPASAYLTVAPELDVVPVRVVAIANARRVNATATAEVVSIVGNQVLRERWRFVQAPGAERAPGQIIWQLDAVAPLAVDPPRGATRLNLTLQDYAMTIDTAVAGEDVVLQGTNVGAEDHEMLVLRFEGGLTTADLLRAAGPALPDGVRYIGQATVPTGAEADLVLTGLEPGSYTVVCLLPTTQGIPHLALGEVASFEVE